MIQWNPTESLINDLNVPNSILMLLCICHLHLCTGEFVAQFKFTVLLMANGPLRITNSLFEPELYKSELDVEDPALKVR